MRPNSTKPVTIILIAVMIVALAAWIFQGLTADDQVANVIGAETRASEEVE